MKTNKWTQVYRSRQSVNRWVSDTDKTSSPALIQYSKVLFTSRKRSLGQGNIFTSVCHSVQGGVCMAKGGMHGEEGCVWQRGHAWWRGANMVKGGACMVKGGMCGEGVCVAGQMATVAGSMHPTGMHSCLKKIWRTYVLFMGPLISLFWTSGDVSYGFQSVSLQLYLCLTEAYVLHVPWDSRLVGHMLTSWSGMNLIKFCPSVSNSKEAGCVPLILCKWCT